MLFFVKIMLKIKVKAGENGKIFGGVTSKEISEELYHLFLQELDESAEIFLADVERKSPLIRIAENICGLFSPVL